MTIRDNRDYIRVLLYSKYRVGGPPNPFLSNWWRHGGAGEQIQLYECQSVNGLSAVGFVERALGMCQGFVV